jgi:peptide chain release factor 1
MEYKQVVEQWGDARQMLEEKLDDDMRELVKAELDELSERKEQLEQEIRILMLPKDPNDDKNVIVEIRGAAGGDEAALFAADLFRMYTKYADSQGWRTSILDANYNDLGGFKEVIFMVDGKGAYSRLKFESGAHRVQRIPTTESGGRIHTSTATVAVLPEVEDVEVEISEKDIRVDVFCSSGAGGQSVNTTKSAVRLTHIPTGLVAQCQDQKSQHKNKDKALEVLRSRLYEQELAKKEAEDATKRTSQVSSGDRSAKIRTYNYAQGRITDHRIGLSIFDLDGFMNGNLHKMIDELQLEANTEKLKESEVL